MPVLDMHATLNRLQYLFDVPSQKITIPAAFTLPGFWAVICAFAKSKGIQKDGIIYENSNLEGYASAMGLSRALWGEDTYQYKRHREGSNYSTIAHLSSPDATDFSTTTINNCLRSYFPNIPKHEHFISQLCDVVGDLHDNVWSHGMASGFSMAQKWKVPKENDEYYLEFALADSGIGFLGELHRVGQTNFNNDIEAIQWCIQEGHSTKKKSVDEWAQRIPGDIINNPLRGIAETSSTENHHMGLGLSKLVTLTETFNGKLWLATGSYIFSLDNSGEKTYIQLPNPWQGVALACRFNTKELPILADTDAEDRCIKEIMDLLRKSS